MLNVLSAVWVSSDVPKSHQAVTLNDISTRNAMDWFCEVWGPSCVDDVQSLEGIRIRLAYNVVRHTLPARGRDWCLGVHAKPAGGKRTPRVHDHCLQHIRDGFRHCTGAALILLQGFSAPVGSKLWISTGANMLSSAIG